MKRFLLLLVPMIFLGACLNVRREAQTWRIVVTAAGKNIAVADCDVTLVLRTADGKEERCGPARTDRDGQCAIVVPAHRFAFSSKAWRLKDVWLEVREGDATRLAPAVGSSGEQWSFLLPTGTVSTPVPGRRSSS